jgi:hypothetical protein
MGKELAFVSDEAYSEYQSICKMIDTKFMDMQTGKRADVVASLIKVADSASNLIMNENIRLAQFIEATEIAKDMVQL